MNVSPVPYVAGGSSRMPVVAGSSGRMSVAAPVFTSAPVTVPTTVRAGPAIRPGVTLTRTLGSSVSMPTAVTTGLPIGPCVAGCGRPGIYRCSQCQIPGYCSADCQHKHWPYHRIQCMQVLAAKMGTAPPVVPVPVPMQAPPVVPRPPVAVAVEPTICSCPGCSKLGVYQCSVTGKPYCSQECQRKDWPAHRSSQEYQECAKLTARAPKDEGHGPQHPAHGHQQHAPGHHPSPASMSMPATVGSGTVI